MWIQLSCNYEECSMNELTEQKYLFIHIIS